MQFFRYFEALAIVTLTTVTGFFCVEVLGWSSIYSSLIAGLVGTVAALLISDLAKVLYDLVRKDSRTPALDVSVIFGLLTIGLYFGMRAFSLLGSGPIELAPAA